MTEENQHHCMQTDHDKLNAKVTSTVLNNVKKVRLRVLAVRVRNPLNECPVCVYTLLDSGSDSTLLSISVTMAIAMVAKKLSLVQFCF